MFREEFKAMKSELSQELHQTLRQMVRSELQSIRNEISTLESSLQFLNEKYETTKSSIATYPDTVSALQIENAYLNSTLQDAQTRLHVMEQHSRSNNIEIQCVPERKQENLISTVIQLSKVVACELKESDIHHCTRVAKANRGDGRPRSIIVKLATPRLRYIISKNNILQQI
jgi:predicted  nucleic acid-binding Zn-ribbon protein